MADDNQRANLYVQFYTHKEQDEVKSLETGAAVHKETEMVKIRWPGDTKREFHANAHEQSDRPEIMDDGSKYWPTWAEAFPKHYEAYQRGESFETDGTPLKYLEVLTDERRKSLQSLNIYSIEDLAALEGGAMKKVGMIGSKLRDAAREHLKRADGKKGEEILRSELSQRDEQIKELQQQMQALLNGDANTSTSLVDALETKADTTPKDEARDFFESMETDDLMAWVTQQANEISDFKKPHPQTGKAKLVDLALEANNLLAEKRGVAA